VRPEPLGGWFGDQDNRGVLEAVPLYGRESEIDALESLIEGLDSRGAAVVVRGEAGIGKSALLEAVIRAAQARDLLILQATGAPSEAELPFAGLHQLLHTRVADIGGLPGPQRAALEAAFGITGAAAPDLFLIALATLHLLGDLAERAPLLLMVEDAQWLDRSTAQVLAFVGRRLGMDRILLLLAVRDDVESASDGAGLEEMRLAPLGEAAAAELLDRYAPDLVPGVRERLLRDAAGNPLALLELPAALDGPEGVMLPEHLPLSERLETAFAARLPDLPRATRTLLLLAAADSGGLSLSELTRAAEGIENRELHGDVLARAVSGRLVQTDDGRLTFRHPLVRSAVYRSASAEDRRAAHAVLAAFEREPSRSVWHRAAAIVGQDEEIALALDDVAEDARQRGALASAVTAHERAAQLSGDPARMPGRLLRAAESAIEVGRPDIAARLVGEVEALALGDIDQGRVAWVRALSDPGAPGEPARMRSQIDSAAAVADAGDSELALKLLWAAATSGFWADRANELSGDIVALAERLPVPEDHPWLLAVLAYAEPIDRGAVVVDVVSRMTPDPAAPDSMWLVSAAAATVGAFDLAEGFATAAVAGLRSQGRLGALAQALVLRAWSDIHIGRWEEAMPDAEEAGRLAQETAQPIWGGGAAVALSILAGLRGDEDAAEVLAADAEHVGLQFGARAVLSVTQLARGLTALGGGRYEVAYAQLRRMFTASDPAYHRMESCWAIGNLAEAAVHSGRGDEVLGVMLEMERLSERTPSPWLHVAMRHARALLADDSRAEALFQQALEADLTRWPFDRARLLLAYGMWLRRQKRVMESRVPLRVARDGFDALRVMSWGNRARQELRAAGETSRRREPLARDELTAQELQIARMAASGMTNRAIGEQLYLSHRTVSAHLYRVFPKLGVTARSELGRVLPEGDPTPS
jgi:DNA-binding CsgD family transcriptional regulator